jgi:hypothetical protein
VEGEMKETVVIVIAMFLVGFGIFAFMAARADDSCRERYGREWYSTTNGRFVCTNAKGELREF